MSIPRRRINQAPAPRPARAPAVNIAANTNAQAHEIHPFELYRVGRLARLFDVDRATIWRWKRDGKLGPWVRIGGIEAMTGERVAALLAQSQQGASDA
jgi:hypothetical protein